MDLFAVVFDLKKQGRKDSTLKPILRRLKFLNKNVDIRKPEKVKEFIAGQNYTDGYKDNLIDAYSYYCRFYGIQWIKPKYMREERITRVPREDDINKIISHAKLKYAVAYSIMRDVGLRPVELELLKVKDVDGIRKDLRETLELFPLLQERKSQEAQTLSGENSRCSHSQGL